MNRRFVSLTLNPTSNGKKKLIGRMLYIFALTLNPTLNGKKKLIGRMLYIFASSSPLKDIHRRSFEPLVIGFDFFQGRVSNF